MRATVAVRAGVGPLARGPVVGDLVAQTAPAGPAPAPAPRVGIAAARRVRIVPVGRVGIAPVGRIRIPPVGPARSAPAVRAVGLVETALLAAVGVGVSEAGLPAPASGLGRGRTTGAVACRSAVMAAVGEARGVLVAVRAVIRVSVSGATTGTVVVRAGIDATQWAGGGPGPAIGRASGVVARSRPERWRMRCVGPGSPARERRAIGTGPAVRRSSRRGVGGGRS